jgi:hypothetical protein
LGMKRILYNQYWDIFLSFHKVQFALLSTSLETNCTVHLNLRCSSFN